MKKHIKYLATELKEFFLKYISGILLLLGLCAWGFGFKIFTSNWDEKYYEIAINVGNTFIIGSLIKFLSISAKSLGIYHEVLSDLIYSRDFLSIRKDVNKIWSEVSKAMIEYKFPEIHEQVLSGLNRYIKFDDNSYYKDYRREIEVKWKDRDSHIVEVEEILDFDIITTQHTFHYKIKTWNQTTDSPIFKETCQLYDLTVNGKPYTDLKLTETRENGKIIHTKDIKLKGSKIYQIHFRRVKTYSIDEDPIIGFQARYLVNDLTVNLRIPDGLSAEFCPSGTFKDFESIVNNSKNHIEKRLRDVVFPKQGYIFALRTTTI